ncbi:MAG: sialate O-acetylesterase [Thiolinea sp.]
MKTLTPYRLWLIACYLLLLLPLTVQAELKLPALISDHMVLQQHSRARLWGQATPATTITARIAGQDVSALTDAQGRWQMRLPYLPAGYYNLQLEEHSGDQVSSTTVITDVAVGPVWLAAGQSNMEWPLERSDSAQQAQELLQDRDLRFFVVSHQTALTPQDDVYGYWVKVTPENALALSGVAFHFAQQLHAAKQIPVGIIQAAWGSTKIQAWSSLETMQNEPALQALMSGMQQQLNLPAAEQARHEQQLLDWEAKNYLPDPGVSTETAAFSAPEFDDSDWVSAELPVLFSELNFTGDGAIWFRRGLTLPDNWAAQDGVLSLGMIDDFDQVFINGVLIGQTDRNTVHHWLQPRHYPVAKGVLQPGQNTLAIRVFDQYGDGGFTGRPAEIQLKTGSQTLPLAGGWKYKASITKPAQQADWASLPPPLYGLRNRNTPAVLYNAMIAPLTHYTLQGVIWYQGESDAKQPEQYQVLFPAMIRQWRLAWQQDLPFLLVQLANFNLPEDDTEQLWATIRAIQDDTARQVPDTGMVSAIDLGEADNVHPQNKRAVGTRLANLALAMIYGEGLGWRDPECYQARRDVKRGRIILHCRYDHFLESRGKITAAEIAGADGVFYPAEMTLADGTLQVRADDVSTVTAVRYAWRNNPQANVHNGDRLPLRPFWLAVED